MSRSKRDRRIQRAEELAAAHPFAAEVLGFYKRAAVLQKSLYAQFENSGSGAAAAEAKALREIRPDVDLLVSEFPEYLSELSAFATKPLAEAARELKSAPRVGWNELLLAEWATGGDGSVEPKSVVAGMFLRPYAEFLAEQAERLPSVGASLTCPFCDGKPVAGALRPEGDGGKRFLICGFCGTEWPFNRLLCASCGETNVDKLPVFTAEQFSHVRVEACDACHRYIKTVDLTKNGHAVAIVDELATIPLNLWAEEHGYAKLRLNILGL
jgi:formate dehydrogenase accessory protein FdhE